MTNITEEELNEVVRLIGNYLKDAVRNKKSKLHTYQNAIFYEFNIAWHDLSNDAYCYMVQPRKPTKLHPTTRSLLERWGRKRESTLGTYIYKCLYNFLRSELKKLRDRRTNPMDVMDCPTTELEPGEEPEIDPYDNGINEYDFFNPKSVESEIIHKQELERYLEEIPENERQALLEQKKLKKVSEEIGIDYGTLKKRIQRWRKKLKINVP